MATLIGGFFQAFGDIFSGIGKQKAAMYNAQVADNNAKMAGQYAERAIQTGNEMAARASYQGAQDLGQQIATLATGTDVHGKSAQAVLAATRMGNKLKALSAADKGQMEAYSARVNQYGFAAQGPLDIYQGNVEEVADITKGVGEGVGAIGKAMPTSWIPGIG
jgi:hypothetical protein